MVPKATAIFLPIDPAVEATRMPPRVQLSW